MNKNMQNRGFIQIIIIMLLLVIILSLLGVSLSSLFSNPILHENFGFLGDWISTIWTKYLAGPFKLLWDMLINLVKSGTGPS